MLVLTKNVPNGRPAKSFCDVFDSIGPWYLKDMIIFSFSPRKKVNHTNQSDPKSFHLNQSGDDLFPTVCRAAQWLGFRKNLDR